MKLFSKTLGKLVAAATLLMSASFSSNAALISADEINGTFTQDILMSINGNAPFVLGSISYGVDFKNNGADEFGNLYSFDSGLTVVAFELFGWTLFDPALFEFGVDTTNYEAGLSFLTMDVQEIGFDDWVYSIFFDAFTGDNFIDIFDAQGLVAFGEVSFSDPTFVSAPSMLGFLLVMGGLLAARRRLA